MSDMENGIPGNGSNKSRWAPNWPRWRHAASMVGPIAILGVSGQYLTPVMGRAVLRNWAIPITQGVTMGACLFWAKKSFKERGEKFRQEQAAREADRIEELRKRGHK